MDSLEDKGFAIQTYTDEEKADDLPPTAQKQEIIELPNDPEDDDGADDSESGTRQTAQSRSSLSQLLQDVARSTFSCTSNHAVSIT